MFRLATPAARRGLLSEREALSDGGVPERGGTDPISPHCSISYGADVDLQQTHEPYAL
jgi:hypothetical protein